MFTLKPMGDGYYTIEYNEGRNKRELILGESELFQLKELLVGMGF